MNGWTRILAASPPKRGNGQRGPDKAPRVTKFTMPTYNKYRNKRTKSLDGITHNSAKQARRWEGLQLMQSAGRIRNLKREVNFTISVCGEKACIYRADHTYEELQKGEWSYIVEDVKGWVTDLYRLKKRLLFLTDGIVIREV